MASHDQDLGALGIHLTMDGSTWVPTPHGRFMAGVLAEQDLVEGKEILELGAGTAVHTILLERKGAKRIVATEIKDEYLATTRLNVEAHDGGRCIEYAVADWLDVDGAYDMIVTNPPFCMSGKTNRRYFIDDLILNGHKRLRPQGELVFVQSSMADIAKTGRRLDENGYDYEIIDRTQGPFRDYYYDDAEFMAMASAIDGGFEVIDGKEHETLSVIRARLRK